MAHSHAGMDMPHFVGTQARSGGDACVAPRAVHRRQRHARVTTVNRTAAAPPDPSTTRPTCVQMLRKADLRVTAARVQTLKVLASRPGHWMSPGEIHAELVRQEAVINIATVYSAILCMESRGLLLREFHAGANGARTVYLLNPASEQAGREPGMFVVCRQCNDSRHVDEPGLRRHLLTILSAQGLAAGEHHLSVHMTCERCA